MTNLQARQEKIQAKRKQTSWRDFVMEIASWAPYNLYKRNWLITVYKDTERLPLVISAKEYNSQRDWYKSVLVYETDFFKNLSDLISHTALPNITEFKKNEWSDFANIVAGVKNAYLSFTITSGSENVLYSSFIKWNSVNIIDSLSVTQHSENIYSSIWINQSTNIFYSKFIDNSNNIWFSDNLVGCTECLMCDWLSNQSYCIENKQYTKEEYFFNKLTILKQRDGFYRMYLWIFNKWNNINSTDVEGEAIYYSQNIKKSRFVSYVSGWWNNYLVWWNEPLTEVYDTFWSASRSTNNCYAGVAHGSWDHHYCNYNSAFGFNVYYSWHCENCSFILWCVWLRNKSYCILNKQYTKEERYEKVDEIFTQMEKDWQLWEFFPATMNPFYFNDTAAYLIDPSFTKEEVTAKWYLRRDEPIKVDIPEWMEIVKTSELWDYEWFDSEWNRSINADILKKVIQDEQWNVYRIIPMEYKFLVKHGLPLPRKHWLERMKENFRIN